MHHTQRVPHCPNCGAPVYRSHTCRAGRPRPEHLTLVPMPATFRDQVRDLARAVRVPDQLALDLVDAEADQLCGLDGCDLAGSCQARTPCAVEQ